MLILEISRLLSHADLHTVELCRIFYQVTYLLCNDKYMSFFFLVALLKSQTEDVRKDLKLSDIRFLGLCNEIFFLKTPYFPLFLTTLIITRLILFFVILATETHKRRGRHTHVPSITSPSVLSQCYEH